MTDHYFSFAQKDEKHTYCFKGMGFHFIFDLNGSNIAPRDIHPDFCLPVLFIHIPVIIIFFFTCTILASGKTRQSAAPTKSPKFIAFSEGFSVERRWSIRKNEAYKRNFVFLKT